MKHYTLNRQAVAQLREAQGLSQVQLAEIVGVGPDMLSRYESGARQPSSAVALKIATALGVRFADITVTKGLDAQGRCDHCGYHVDSPGYKAAHGLVKVS